MTRYLCELVDVSQSVYYRWLAEDQRHVRAAADEEDIILIRYHFEALNARAGALVIKMRLEQISHVIMNHKKIRRLIRKAGLIAVILQANPYRRMAQVTHEHLTCPNLLERRFNQGEPKKVFLTDITYLRYGGG